jgi:hypothetical protein
LDRAYEWLCHQRRAYPPDAAIWSFRRRWPQEKERLRAELLEGHLRFELLRRITLKDGSEIDLWSPRDALLLKCLAWLLGERLGLSKRCAHLKGHGGAKAGIQAVRQRLRENRFVLKTDVRSYYASIDHELLLDRLERVVLEPGIVALVAQYLKRTSERGGLFYDFERGISRGCPLSPIISAFFLAELDAALERTGPFFVRFMDDVIVLAPTRWKLRRAVKVVNEVLTGLGLEKAPEKTFIGRVERGFDFLGFRLSPDGITVAEATWKRFRERALRLYERDRREPCSPPRLDAYVTRWDGLGAGRRRLAGRVSRGPRLASECPGGAPAIGR